MRILVNGMPAAIKVGTSIDYYSENRLFRGRDAYTLSIVFPLRGCEANRRIFGYLNRIDIEKKKIFYDCEIHERGVVLYGSLLIVGVNEVEVEGQFVEGRCEQTACDPFEEVYINKLDLGAPPALDYKPVPAEAWKSIDAGAEEVALPWINESYPDIVNNDFAYQDKKYVWADEARSSGSSDRPSTGSGMTGTHRPATSFSGETHLSWQPYLLTIAKRICAAVGYEANFSEWEASEYRHLIICNTLPASWDEYREYKYVMPGWTVSEFFEKLELLLMGEFDIDHRGKIISFSFSATALSAIEPVNIEPVEDEYAVEISTDNENCEYIGAKRLAYKECSHSMQPYYACDWYVESADSRKYADLSALAEANKMRMVADSKGNSFPVYGERGRLLEWGASTGVSNDVNRLLYAEAEDMHFVFRSTGTKAIAGYRPTGYTQIYALQPVNLFGSGCRESDDVQTEEIEFVPACIMSTYLSDDDDKGYMLFLNFSSYQDDAMADTGEDGAAVRQPLSAVAIESGEKDDVSEYYDVVYVGFWDGKIYDPGYAPCPILDSVNITEHWIRYTVPVPGLRLGSDPRNLQNQIPKIDSKQKLSVSFLGHYVPDPRAIFYIRGLKYVCEKITATFTEEGMSQLLKGEFYPIVE